VGGLDCHYHGDVVSLGGFGLGELGGYFCNRIYCEGRLEIQFLSSSGFETNMTVVANNVTDKVE
jgi:hypothetical protein